MLEIKGTFLKAVSSKQCGGTMRLFISLITLWVLVISVGCQSNPVEANALLDATPSEISVVVPPIQGDITQMTPSLSTPATSGLEALIEKAKKDLAQRLPIPTTQINLVEAKAVVWPDSSLGCPQPGMAYLQVPEDGALIVLEARGNIYEYHNGGKRGLFLCEKVLKNPTPRPQIDIFNLTPQKSDTSSTPDNSIPPGEDK